MLKVRFQGLPSEVDRFIADFKAKYEVVQVSKAYPMRHTAYVSVYVEVKCV